MVSTANQIVERGWEKVCVCVWWGGGEGGGVEWDTNVVNVKNVESNCGCVKCEIFQIPQHTVCTENYIVLNCRYMNSCTLIYIR